MVQKILAPIWNTKTEIATRVRQRIERVLDRAYVLMNPKPPNPARWTGHLTARLHRASECLVGGFDEQREMLESIDPELVKALDQASANKRLIERIPIPPESDLDDDWPPDDLFAAFTGELPKPVTGDAPSQADKEAALEALKAFALHFPDMTPGLMFHGLNYFLDERAAEGDLISQWTEYGFRLGYARALDFWDERKQIADAEAERDERRRRAGRPATVESQRRNRIALALGVQYRRAYEIEQYGAADLEQRKTLARVFASDPDRNCLAAWELRDAVGNRRTHGRASDSSFRAFCLSDSFHDLIVAGVAELRAQYQQGRLPDNFKSDLDFVKATDGLGIDMESAIAILEAYHASRKSR